MSEKEEFNPMLKFIKEKVDKLPLSSTKKQELLKKLEEIYKITADSREPRIALVGRRGAGKSSLINALFKSKKQYVSSVKSGTGKSEWLWFPGENDKKIKLLDSRGLGESEKPTEEHQEDTPIEELKLTISKEMPDVFLFLIKAKETDARIDADLAELKILRDFIKEKHNYDVPVICVVTQVDELDPPHYKSLPLDGHPKKSKNIGEAVNLMNKRFEENSIPLITTIPVCSYIDFDEDGNVEYDMRWNIDELGCYLIESLPSEAKLKTARASQLTTVKKKYAFKIVTLFTTLTGLVGGINNIPIADLPLITALQALMVTIIAFVAGKDISTKTAAEFIGSLGVNIGIAFIAREGARALVKFIPGAGNLISGTIAGTVTVGIGSGAIAYFIEGKDIEESRQAYEKGKDSLENNSDLV